MSDFKAIVERITREGDLNRNSGTNSIKSVKEELRNVSESFATELTKSIDTLSNRMSIIMDSVAVNISTPMEEAIKEIPNSNGNDETVEEQRENSKKTDTVIDLLEGMSKSMEGLEKGISNAFDNMVKGATLAGLALLFFDPETLMNIVTNVIEIMNDVVRFGNKIIEGDLAGAWEEFDNNWIAIGGLTAVLLAKTGALSAFFTGLQALPSALDKVKNFFTVAEGTAASRFSATKLGAALGKVNVIGAIVTNVKDGVDIAVDGLDDDIGTQIKGEDIGGVIGGAVGAAIGAIAGPVGIAAGASFGNMIGEYIGGIIDPNTMKALDGQKAQVAEKEAALKTEMESLLKMRQDGLISETEFAKETARISGELTAVNKQQQDIAALEKLKATRQAAADSYNNVKAQIERLEEAGKEVPNYLKNALDEAETQFNNADAAFDKATIEARKKYDPTWYDPIGEDLGKLWEMGSNAFKELGQVLKNLMKSLGIGLADMVSEIPIPGAETVAGKIYAMATGESAEDYTNRAEAMNELTEAQEELASKNTRISELKDKQTNWLYDQEDKDKDIAKAIAERNELQKRLQVAQEKYNNLNMIIEGTTDKSIPLTGEQERAQAIKAQIEARKEAMLARNAAQGGNGGSGGTSVSSNTNYNLASVSTPMPDEQSRAFNYNALPVDF